jgi:hypothetical protein
LFIWRAQRVAEIFMGHSVNLVESSELNYVGANVSPFQFVLILWEVEVVGAHLDSMIGKVISFADSCSYIWSVCVEVWF